MPATVIELHLATEWPDFAEELLFAQGAQAVRQIDAHDEPVLEPAPGETPLWRETITCGVFTIDTDLDAVEKVARSLLPDGATLRSERKIIEDIDWRDAWKAHVHPMSFGGGRLWICPSHLEIPEEARASAKAVVTLDPGLAFGTGTHPSTALCLDWLAYQELEDRSILDYGCGSGILAIAALKLGARHAQAVDIDPQALEATLANAQLNEVDSRITCLSVDQAVDEPVDIVLANILARPLIGLAPRLASATAVGGKITLAGILNEQAEEIRTTYGNWFDFEADGSHDGWSRVAGTRR